MQNDQKKEMSCTAWQESLSFVFQLILDLPHEVYISLSTCSFPDGQIANIDSLATKQAMYSVSLGFIKYNDLIGVLHEINTGIIAKNW